MRFAGGGCRSTSRLRGDAELTVELTVNPAGSVMVETRTPGGGARTILWTQGQAMTWMRPQLTSFLLRWPGSDRPSARTAWVLFSWSSWTRSLSRQRPRIGPMLPIGSPQRRRDLRVRHRRVGGQHLDQLLPAIRQTAQRAPNVHRPFVGQQRLVDVRLGAGQSLEDGVVVAEHQPLAQRQHPQALAPGGDHQPGPDPLRIDPVDVLEQPQPGRLGNVRRITVGQPEAARDRPDQPGVPVDQLFPGKLLAGRRESAELADSFP